MLKYIARLSLILAVAVAIINSPVTHSTTNHYTTMGNGVST